LDAENALAAQLSSAVVIKIFFSMISISSVIGINERIDRIMAPAKFRGVTAFQRNKGRLFIVMCALDTAKSEWTIRLFIGH
jgi:hypothetical protein